MRAATTLCYSFAVLLGWSSSAGALEPDIRPPWFTAAVEGWADLHCGLGQEYIKKQCTAHLDNICDQFKPEVCSTETYYFGVDGDPYLYTPTYVMSYVRHMQEAQSVWFCKMVCQAGCAAKCREAQTPQTPPIEDRNEFCEYSPIVLDFGETGFEFTDAVEGVSFDLDGDGSPDSIAWTTGDGDDGFLALDRDGDGNITSGLELFGNFTEQPASEDPHGYRALAVFDEAEHGGNRDGLITADDAIWEQLVVWVDVSHDGISQADEMRSLAEHHVALIPLDVVLSRSRDRHGNELRYRGKFYLADGSHHWSADVFFKIQ